MTIKEPTPLLLPHQKDSNLKKKGKKNIYTVYLNYYFFVLFYHYGFMIVLLVMITIFFVLLCLQHC